MPEITTHRETYDVPAHELAEFKADVKHAGAHIVRSAPVPTGYVVTIEF